MHPAEGGVGGGPDLHPGGVRREDRAADVVGADEGDGAAFDHWVLGYLSLPEEQRAGIDGLAQTLS